MLSLLLTALTLPFPWQAAIPEPGPQATVTESSRGAQGAAGRRGRPDGDRIRGIFGEDLGSADDPEAALGGRRSSPFSPPVQLTLGPPINVGPQSPVTGNGVLPWRVSRVTLSNTGTGWDENFLFGAPVSPVSPAPLLVVFHGYSVSEFDVLYNTDYFQKALDRGWYIMAPLGAHQFHFSVPYAQENVRAALGWMTSHFFIDPDRIYGVGFSMGAGLATSYAARHLDPNEARFAAVVNHTGTTSLRHVWANGSDTSLLESTFLFGGTPAQQTFNYLRVSTIDINAAGMVDPLTDIARNLVHVPAKNWSSVNDPLGYLVFETQAFHGQLLAEGGNSIISSGNQPTHSWSTLDENAVMNFLDPIVRTDPAPATLVRVIADRTANYYGIDITQGAPGALTPFQWKAAVAINRFLIDQSTNLAAAAFLPEDFGLDTAQPLEVVMGSFDGLPLTVRVRGYALLPGQVLRDGVATGAWSYDPSTSSVVFTETATSTFHLWRIEP